MNRKSIVQRAEIIRLLVEGNSMRSTSRIADCSINTVTKVFVQAGIACERYQQEKMIDLECARLQVDEIWSFVYSKDKNTDKDNKEAGSIWTYFGICPDTKLVPCWRVGPRDAQTTKEFMADLAPRLKTKTHLTTDGFAKYRDAVDDAFGADVDYSILMKIYDEEKRNQYIGALRSAQIGMPNMSEVTTAHVERQNLNLRMSNRRFGRKTNAFSKKMENHCHSVALHFMYHNFCRIHTTTRVTPAMAAGVTKRLWDVDDIAAMMQY